MCEIEQLRDLIEQAKRIVAFTGAGISTESGIPDFRSPGGIWTKYQPIYFDDFMSSEEMRREAWRRKFATDETMACDLFIVLGSSLVVYPAAGFPRVAKRKGARLVIVNRDPTDQDDDADLVVHAEIGPTLSRVVGVN